MFPDDPSGQKKKLIAADPGEEAGRRLHRRTRNAWATAYRVLAETMIEAAHEIPKAA